MLEALPTPRAELAGHAPRISTVKINPEYIGMVIGKGGETIRALESDHDVQIDIEEDGTILVYATEGTKSDAAISAITALTKEPEVGDTYTGKVVKTTQFGAFVELKKGTDGLLHVSERRPRPRGPHRGRDHARRRLDVIVQEVDKDRGRIGLKLVAKHEDGGLVQPEELIERAKDAPPRRKSRVASAAGAAAARPRPAPDCDRGGTPGSRASLPSRLEAAHRGWPLGRMNRSSAPERAASSEPVGVPGWGHRTRWGQIPKGSVPKLFRFVGAPDGHGRSSSACTCTSTRTSPWV